LAGFLVLLFGVGGFFFWRTIPEILIGQIWMAVAALLAVVYVVMTVRANRATQLANTGGRGRARVLEMGQTSTYINNQPRVKMRLRIEAPGVSSFETEDTVTVPLTALGSLQPGRPLTVALDPPDPQRGTERHPTSRISGARPDAGDARVRRSGGRAAERR